MSKVINGQVIPSGALLLFEQSKKLSRKDGFCHAGNQYLADKTGLKKKTISKYYKLLADAGMVSRDYTWDDEQQIIAIRRIFCVEEKIYMQPQTNPAVTLADVIAMGASKAEEAVMENEQKARRRRIYKYADIMQIPRFSVYKAIQHWGDEYVEEKLCIAFESHPRESYKNVFFKACWQGWKPGKRAQKRLGKGEDPKPRRVVPVPDIKDEKPMTALETLEMMKVRKFKSPKSFWDDLKTKCISEVKQLGLDEVEEAARILDITKSIEALATPPKQGQAAETTQDETINEAVLQRDILATDDPARRAALIGKLPKEKQQAMWQLCIKLDKERAAAS